MNCVGKNYARAFRPSKQGAEKASVVHRNHMQAFFARRIEPDGDLRIGEAAVVRHQEYQSISSSTKMVVCARDQPCGQGQRAKSCRNDSDRPFLHPLGTTCPSVRAHTEPKTVTPSAI